MSEPRSNHVAVLWVMVALLAAVGLAMVALTAPLERLLGESAHAIPSAIHGLMAGLFFVTVTIGLFQGFRLLAGAEIPPVELQLGSVVNTVLALFTILAGNWIYIPYRAKAGPRSFFLEQTPEVHKIFFEFKEFVALFTLPLAACAAYLFVMYGAGLHRHRALRTMSAILLMLVFFYFMVAFGLGAAITKLKPI